MASSVDLTSFPTARNDATESSYSKTTTPYLSNGVIDGIGNKLAGFADSTGMHVKIPSGRGVVNGIFGDSTSQQTLDIATAHSTLDRLDRVVLRLTTTSPATVSLTVITGTPGSVPALPALLNDSTHIDSPVLIIRVNHGDATVPSVNVADDRVYANNPIWNQVGVGTAPIFEHSWTNFGSGHPPVGYCVDLYGMVHLRGSAKLGTMGQAIFTLSAGYVPVYNHRFPIVTNDVFGFLDVSNNGTVTPSASSGSNAYVSLDGIAFSIRP